MNKACKIIINQFLISYCKETLIQDLEDSPCNIYLLGSTDCTKDAFSTNVFTLSSSLKTKFNFI